MSDGGNPVPNKFCSAREPGDEQLGAMHQKIAIFKEGNSVCRVQNVFQELSFYIQKEMNSWGRCVRKWRFSKKETAFAGGTIFSGDFILYSERNEQLGAMRQKMTIFKRGNSVCRVHNFSGALNIFF